MSIVNESELNFMKIKSIMNYYRSIKPIVRMDEKAFYVREFSTNEVIEDSIQISSEDLVNPADMGDYEYITDIIVHHIVKKGKDYNPTLAEVISQIPKDILEKVSAFEIITSPLECKSPSDYKFKPNVIYFSTAVTLYSMK